MTLISVVLGTSSEAASDANTLALLDYGFASFRLREPVVRGAVLAHPGVRNRPGVHATVVAGSTFTRVFVRGTHLRLRLEVPQEIAGPLPRHAVVGTALVLADGRVVGRVPLLLAGALPAVRPVGLALGWPAGTTTLLWLVLPVGVLVGVALIRRERTRARRAEPA
jgi:D-alanyl-D-alanine carboxypeptidase